MVPFLGHPVLSVTFTVIHYNGLLEINLLSPQLAVGN